MTDSSNRIEQIKITAERNFFQPPNIRELLFYRYLLLALIKKDFQVRYKQTIAGSLWAIVKPFSTMLVFTFFFGHLLKIPSDNLPYPVFSYSGLLLWTYFSSSLTAASNSLIANANLITKVYFPREYLPLTAVIKGVVDYFFSIIFLLILMLYYGFRFQVSLLAIPIILLMTLLLALGGGFWLSALNVKFRDIQFVVPFFIQLLLYSTPVIYPLSVAGKYRRLLYLNPLTGLIQAQRSIIFSPETIDFFSLFISTVIIITVLISGWFFFKRAEYYLADLI